MYLLKCLLSFQYVYECVCNWHNDINKAQESTFYFQWVTILSYLLMTWFPLAVCIETVVHSLQLLFRLKTIKHHFGLTYNNSPLLILCCFLYIEKAPQNVISTHEIHILHGYFTHQIQYVWIFHLWNTHFHMYFTHILHIKYSLISQIFVHLGLTIRVSPGTAYCLKCFLDEFCFLSIFHSFWGWPSGRTLLLITGYTMCSHSPVLLSYFLLGPT